VAIGPRPTRTGGRLGLAPELAQAAQRQERDQDAQGDGEQADPEEHDIVCKHPLSIPHRRRGGDGERPGRRIVATGPEGLVRIYADPFT
jgi:hypothetical protein